MASLGLHLPNDPAAVRALQRDLRALGYLRGGIDGDFGANTEAGVRALQNDLLGRVMPGQTNQAAPKISSFNKDANGAPRVTAVTGVADQPFLACLTDIVSSSAIALLPQTQDPGAQNAAALAAIDSYTSAIAPTPFVIAIVYRESGGRHFHVPDGNDEDRFVTVGLDRNDHANPDHITSRGYGIGQYTFFHHPLTETEMAGYVADPVRNIRNTFAELRQKFDSFVVGPTDRADDRLAEHPVLPLRLCKYQPSHPLYMRDCKACALAARKLEITRGTPWYPGATGSYAVSDYYKSAEYTGVPDRADFLCDWPYAARRYNGGGNNSYHYQTLILLNLLR
jgi:peptidoglycan hydrolase-like protein with peptidoglycan-binding domain